MCNPNCVIATSFFYKIGYEEQMFLGCDSYSICRTKVQRCYRVVAFEIEIIVCYFIQIYCHQI